MHREDANANPKLIHWLQFKTIPHLTLAHRSHCRECALFVWEDGFPWGETLWSDLLYPKTLSHQVLCTCSTSETQTHRCCRRRRSTSDLNHMPQNKTRTATKPAAICIMDRLHANQLKWNEKCIYFKQHYQTSDPRPFTDSPSDILQ